MQSFDGIELGSLERGQYARDRAYYHAQRQPEEVIAYSQKVKRAVKKIVKSLRYGIYKRRGLRYNNNDETRA